MLKNKKIAIVLFNLGGPQNLEAVKPFLFNLFNDHAIISLPQPLRFLLAKFISARREKKARKIYEQIGGKSPILEITSAQANSLEKELSFFGNFKVFIAMRYSQPNARDAIEKIADFGPDQIILLPLYAQFSTATTDSSFDDFSQELHKFLANSYNKKNGGFFKKLTGNFSKKSRNAPIVKKICCYFEEENFILSHAKLIRQKILESNLNLSEIRILFSAHGLPQKLIDGGDPYVFQITKSAQRILEKLREILQKDGFFADDFEKKIDHIICYQSKVGPLKWTSPSLEQEIRRVALDNKNPLIVPIAFVSEHSETLVELDIEYKELADKLLIKKYLRVPALNVDGHFIDSLALMCRKVCTQDGEIFSGCDSKRACLSEFKRCVNSNC